MRVAVAGVPGAWSTERMCAALEAEGMQSFVFSLGDCLHDLTSGRVTVSGFDLSQLDGIVVKKLGPQTEASARLRLHLLRQLEQTGVRIFSPVSVIDDVMDRYRMTMTMVDAGLPVPRTFSFETESDLMAAVEELGATVVKPVYTSKARGMFRLPAASGDAPGEWPGGRGLAQQFVKSPGRDIGACVLGGRFVGAFHRVACDGQWVTSTSAGGNYAPCELPREGVMLAERASDLFDLDYTVVDLVETGEGYQIYEVSAFGGFRGLWEAGRHDVAREYARYIKCDLLG